LELLKEPFLQELDKQVVKADSTDSIFYDSDFVLKDRSEWDVYIDALFIPGYIDELLNLLPQVPFNYINTTIYGTNEWIVEDLSESDIRRYSDGSYFVPDQYFVDYDYPGWSKFERSYSNEFGQEPTRLAAQGYDAASLVTSALVDGILTPRMLRGYLANIDEFPGVASKIAIDENGANKSARIYKFSGRNVYRVK
jgi:branched-chain amino acid transport system substrate-binding protein